MLRAIVLVLLALAQSAVASPIRDGVNAVTGDDSWIARFGVAPGPDADEQLRLRVHLEYIEQMLRAVDTTELAPDLRDARARNLDLLRAYHQRGVFPTNGAFAGRRPHFIDEAGRICAVGYLIEQTAGRAVAEAINARYEWSYLWEIRGDEVEHWIASSGLTLIELAMIQPGYRPRPIEPIKPPVIEETEEQVRQQIVALVNRATPEIQSCANAIGLRSATKLRITVDVPARGALTSGIPRLDSDALSVCIVRVIGTQLVRYTQRRTGTMRFIHHVQIAKAAGAAFDREALAKRLHGAFSTESTCLVKTAAAINVRVAVDPSGRFDLISIDGGDDIDRTQCARRAIARAQIGFFGFRGKRTELEISL